MQKYLLVGVCLLLCMSLVQAYTINYYEFGNTSNASTVNPNWALQLQALGLSPTLNVENFDDASFNSDIQVYDAADNAWSYSVYSSWRVTGNGLYTYGPSTSASEMDALGINFLQPGGITQFAVHIGALNYALNIYINGVFQGNFLAHDVGRQYNQIMTIQAAVGESITNLYFTSVSEDAFIYDNLSYGGTGIAVPEPVSWLGMVLCLGLAWLRKRVHRKNLL